MKNFCERLCILCHKEEASSDSVLRALPDILDHPQDSSLEQTASVQSDPNLYDEKAAILKALASFRNNRGKTAEYLGMNPSTLWRKMKKYGISVPR